STILITDSIVTNPGTSMTWSWTATCSGSDYLCATSWQAVYSPSIIVAMNARWGPVQCSEIRKPDRRDRRGAADDVWTAPPTRTSSTAKPRLPVFNPDDEPGR